LPVLFKLAGFGKIRQLVFAESLSRTLNLNLLQLILKNQSSWSGIDRCCLCLSLRLKNLIDQLAHCRDVACNVSTTVPNVLIDVSIALSTDLLSGERESGWWRRLYII